MTLVIPAEAGIQPRVIPAEAGIQRKVDGLDPDFRRDDDEGCRRRVTPEEL
ncbi:MAG: hypothetical protein LHV69_03480 [Elusimicrobia bacterium]|nr:hypothetical protein [Candidatus Obscuribacterium magneticum]